MTVYSTSKCKYCDELKKFLSANGVKYTEFNVGENKEKLKEMVESTDQMGVPVTNIDGTFVVGFDEVVLKKQLGIE